MRRTRHLVFIYLYMTFSVAAQTTGGLIKRTPESVEQTRRLERQVTLDIQVTDASGKAVNGLEEQDLTVLDNGQSQIVTSFREIGGNGDPTATEAIVLFDTMNATFEDVVIEREGIDKFLRLNGGHLSLPVSIVFLADTGVKLLKASQDGNSLAEDLKKLPTPIRVIGSAQGAEGAQDRSQLSLKALRMLTTYEATRAGRKLLIWVGPGWPLLSRSTVDVSPQNQRRYFASIVDTTTALRRAHITLYSVAPLNLAQGGGQNSFLYQTYLKGVETPAQADSPNLALQVLAVHSGGLVLSKSSDLAGQIALCMADGRDYYEVSFDAAEGDEIRYRALQVKLKRTGVAARTSTEYYAGVPQSTAGLPAPAAASKSTTGSALPALQAEAHLVIEDVTVVDKNGPPIKGLSAADFLLREDNNPQKIVSLEEHSAAEGAMDAVPTDNAMIVERAQSGVTLVSNKPPAGNVWNVFLIDPHNTPNDARRRLQSQIEQFLKQLPQQQPVALVTMLSHIKIESPFPDGAGAAYRFLRENGLGLVDGSTPADIVGRHQDVLMPSADIAGTTIVNQANVGVNLQANRAQTTMDCFSELAQWLSPYPGRKNVYWPSGGFPLQGQPFDVAGYSLNTPGLGPDTAGSQVAMQANVPTWQRRDFDVPLSKLECSTFESTSVTKL
jgi:VWFA-related protein